MFDEQVVRLDPKIRPLLDQFVCVRMIQANGLDLSLFQFDYDLTFAAFFLNPDHTIYGRFGSRSSEKNVANDISIEGFGKALEKALELHKGYPKNKEKLASKQPKTPLAARPEDLPRLKGKYSPQINLTGKIVPNCIHCHMIEEGERLYFRNKDELIPEAILFPWPMPDVLGLRMDPKECATVLAVASNSPAANAGLRGGDKILELNDAPIISTADIQWVLETVLPGDELKLKFVREKTEDIARLKLSRDWRRKSENGWRSSNWDLRRMAFGGLYLKEATPEERAANKISSDRLALRAEHVGEYGEHAVAKKAGFKKNDIITAIDGDSGYRSESDALALILNSHKRGESVRFNVKRGDSEEQIELKTQ